MYATISMLSVHVKELIEAFRSRLIEIKSAGKILAEECDLDAQIEVLEAIEEYIAGKGAGALVALKTKKESSKT